MSISFMLFLQILKLFLMCAMGFGIVKAGILKSSDSGPLSAVALYIVCPCVYLNAFQVDYSPEQAKALLVTFIAVTVIISCCLIICTLLSRPLRLTDVEITSAAYSNAGNMIIPIISSMLGEEWVFYTTAFITVQMAFFWTHMSSMFSGKFDLKKIVTNVNMISVAAALSLYLLKIRLPETVLGAVSAAGSMIGPLSMIITGMLLANVDFREVFSRKRAWLVAALRLLVLPALLLPLFILVCRVSGIENSHMIMMIVFLGAAAPGASTVVQMARLYDHDAEYAGALNVMTTMLSIFTLPLMVGIYTFFLPV